MGQVIHERTEGVCILMFLDLLAIEAHEGERLPGLEMLLASVLLYLHLFVDILEKFEVDQLLVCGHKVQSIVLCLTSIDCLPKRVLLEPLVQGLLARIILFRMLADRQQGLRLLKSVLEQLYVLGRKA